MAPDFAGNVGVSICGGENMESVPGFRVSYAHHLPPQLSYCLLSALFFANPSGMLKKNWGRFMHHLFKMRIPQPAPVLSLNTA
jgi:hypothetical protein